MKYFIILLLGSYLILNAQESEQVMIFDPTQMIEIENLTQQNEALQRENILLREKLSAVEQQTQENNERKNRELVLFETMKNLNERVKSLKNNNTTLSLQNKNLKTENESLKQQIAHLDRSLLITKNKLEKAFEKLTQQERSLAITKIKNSVTLDKTKQYYPTNSMVEGEGLHTKSAPLQKKYNNYRQRYLINNNMYRIPVYRLNVRRTPTNASQVVMTLAYGEIISFDKVSRVFNNNQFYYRLHTQSGWIYVTDLGTLDVQKNLDIKYQEQ